MAGTTGSLGSKDVLDKFYTTDSKAQWCISKLRLNDFDCIIEPSAGGGAFSKQISGCIAYDIAPEYDSIQQADWLTLDKSIFDKYNNILVIGNPPFGKNDTLAMQFIRESASCADCIAFILPKGFKKSSYKNRVPLDFWLTQEYDIPADSFTLNSEKYAVPCVFQIWEKRDTPRVVTKQKTTSDFFVFTTKSDCDLRIQRVGGRAGKASTDLDVSEQSNYFVKITDERLNISTVMHIVNSSVFPTVDDTTGPRSLSKSELVDVVDNNILNFLDRSTI